MSYKTWGTDEVAEWVRNIGKAFEDVAVNMVEAGVTGDFLDEIGDEDLEEMGLKKAFHRKRFKHALTILKASDTGPQNRASSKSVLKNSPLSSPPKTPEKAKPAVSSKTSTYSPPVNRGSVFDNSPFAKFAKKPKSPAGPPAVKTFSSPETRPVRGSVLENSPFAKYAKKPKSPKASGTKKLFSAGAPPEAVSAPAPPKPPVSAPAPPKPPVSVPTPPKPVSAPAPPRPAAPPKPATAPAPPKPVSAPAPPKPPGPPGPPTAVPRKPSALQRALSRSNIAAPPPPAPPTSAPAPPKPPKPEQTLPSTESIPNFEPPKKLIEARLSQRIMSIPKPPSTPDDPFADYGSSSLFDAVNRTSHPKAPAPPGAHPQAPVSPGTHPPAPAPPGTHPPAPAPPVTRPPAPGHPTAPPPPSKHPVAPSPPVANPSIQVASGSAPRGSFPPPPPPGLADTRAPGAHSSISSISSLPPPPPRASTPRKAEPISLPVKEEPKKFDPYDAFDLDDFNLYPEELKEDSPPAPEMHHHMPDTPDLFGKLPSLPIEPGTIPRAPGAAPGAFYAPGAPPGAPPGAFSAPGAPPPVPGAQPGQPGTETVSLKKSGQPGSAQGRVSVLPRGSTARASTKQKMSIDLSSMTQEADRSYLCLDRPGTEKDAQVEFSTSVSICCASLQLSTEHLTLLIKIAERLRGREMLNLDLSNAGETTKLVAHEEFLQICYLIGFELDVETHALVCNAPPSEEHIEVFQSILKEFQYSGMDSYSVQFYEKELQENELEVLKIIIALTHEYAQTSEDVLDTLALFLPYITTHEVMLRMLKKWFEWCAERSHEKLNRTGTIRYKIATIVKYLMREYRQELEVGNENVHLHDLLEIIKNQDLIAYSHIEAVIRDSQNSFIINESHIEGDKSEKVTLSQQKAESIADQITLLNKKLFSEITMKEILDRNMEESSALYEWLERYANITRWAKLSIFTEADVDNRATRVKWLFKVTEKLYQNRDWFAFLAMIDALKSPQVQAFTTTWKQVYTKKFRSKRDYSGIYQNWLELAKPSTLKREFWLLEAPAVPPYSVILSNVSIIEEYQTISKTKIELFCHLRKLHRLTKHIKKLQASNYQFEKSSTLQNALDKEFSVQSRLKKANVTALFIQGLKTDGLTVPMDIQMPRVSVVQ